MASDVGGHVGTKSRASNECMRASASYSSNRKYTNIIMRVTDCQSLLLKWRQEEKA
jgi:hypothetical protein